MVPQMRIGLYDVDSHNFPNLPLMKISAYHKAKGDTVEFADHITHYDKVYVSKVFGDEYSQFNGQAFDADENGRIAAQSLFTEASIEENFKLLLNTVRQMNTVVPPLFVAYLHLCPTLRYFGNAANDEFGDVYETGIMVPLDEIDSAKRDRHIGSFERYLAGNECE